MKWRAPLGSIQMTGNLMTGRELANLRVSWEQRANAGGQWR
jgi:hypothetical protein